MIFKRNTFPKTSPPANDWECSPPHANLMWARKPTANIRIFLWGVAAAINYVCLMSPASQFRDLPENNNFIANSDTALSDTAD